MHMADALVAPPVAAVAGIAATALIIVASRKVSEIKRPDILPLMGVLGAFVFAAQMINFSIPGTGSSGHIIGGVLLGALVGPWAAFITLCSVIIIQCLVFADGGLLALGCNLINMAAVSCLVAYPFIYKPIARFSVSKARLMTASVASCVVGLEIGALLVTAETELSGITALPASEFLLFMLPIHLAIGLCEGIATGMVICFVAAYKPDMLYSRQNVTETGKSESRMSKKTKIILLSFIIVTLVLAAGFSWIASGNPDGLEWSIEHLTGNTELAPSVAPPTAMLPDYSSTFSGLIGGLITIVFLWGICSLFFRSKRERSKITSKTSR